MKILLLGSGGREHALGWKIAQSPKVEHLYIAPGNAGTANVGENIPVKATDFPALKDFALKNKSRYDCGRSRRPVGRISMTSLPMILKQIILL